MTTREHGNGVTSERYVGFLATNYREILLDARVYFFEGEHLGRILKWHAPGQYENVFWKAEINADELQDFRSEDAAIEYLIMNH